MTKYFDFISGPIPLSAFGPKGESEMEAKYRNSMLEIYLGKEAPALLANLDRIAKELNLLRDGKPNRSAAVRVLMGLPAKVVKEVFEGAN